MDPKYLPKSEILQMDPEYPPKSEILQMDPKYPPKSKILQDTKHPKEVHFDLEIL